MKRQDPNKEGEASVTFGESDVKAMELMETETYPFSACLSDAGGAAGLFLGLSLIGQILFQHD